MCLITENSTDIDPQFEIWVLPAQTSFILKGVTDMRTAELSMGETQAIMKLREEGKSVGAIAQTLAIASTTIWNVLRKKETTVY